MVSRIETERLILRTIEINDSSFMEEQFAKPEIAKFMSKAAPWFPQNGGGNHYISTTLLPAIKRKEHFVFVMELENRPIGMIHYFPRKDQSPGYEYGFLLDDCYQGRGYMSEAMTVANTWIFNNTSIQEIWAINSFDNCKSMVVQKKNHFTYLGQFKTSVPFVGEQEFEQRWILRKEDWPH